MKTFTNAWLQIFVDGVVEHELKELCRVCGPAHGDDSRDHVVERSGFKPPKI